MQTNLTAVKYELIWTNNTQRSIWLIQSSIVALTIDLFVIYHYLGQRKNSERLNHFPVWIFMWGIQNANVRRLNTHTSNILDVSAMP